MKIQEWLVKQGWQGNPFVFSIQPFLMSGYLEQMEKISSAIDSGHKLVLVIGPTGSGKTTFLRYLENNSKTDVLFLGKPPKTPEEFVEIFNLKYPTMLPWKRLKSIYQIPQCLSKKQKLLLLCDEIHEAPMHVLEWLRVLNDHCDNLTLVFSGLPIFETRLMQKLETLRKRVACKIELFSLTKEDTTELIKKRIESVGGHGTEPFSKEALDSIFDQSAGFPREILRTCDSMINKAAALNMDVITPDAIEKQPEQAKIDMTIFSDKQKQILELLVQPMAPADIINAIGLENYKSATHALRAINNILKRMMELTYVERTKKNRTYMYSLSPKLKTIFVIA